MNSALTEREIQQFSRHILLPEIGGLGQKRLLETEVVFERGLFKVDYAVRYLIASGMSVALVQKEALPRTKSKRCMVVSQTTSENADLVVSLSGARISPLLGGSFVALSVVKHALGLSQKGTVEWLRDDGVVSIINVQKVIESGLYLNYVSAPFT